MASISIRPPTFSPAKAPADFTTPSIPWLMETWHVTHSTLPMWKSKRNVKITYTALDPSSPSIAKENTDRVGDLVTYQSLDEDKVSEIKGIDKAASNDSRGEWNWRGKGFLKIASSHWEVLGWGEEAEGGNKWVVTVFAKTMFTPAGIDIYSKAPGGIQASTLETIKAGLAAVEDSDVNKMAADLFEVKVDGTKA